MIKLFLIYSNYHCLDSKNRRKFYVKYVTRISFIPDDPHPSLNAFSSCLTLHNHISSQLNDIISVSIYF